jgi:hypothetical protein
MGDAALRCDAQVVALKPWGLLRGDNGHACLTFHALDILDPGTIHNRGFEKLRGLSQLGSHGGITSFSPIRIHISLLDPHEYGVISNAQMSAAKIFLDAWTVGQDAYLPGLGPKAIGSVMTWTTRRFDGGGHTECLNCTRRAPPSNSLLNTWVGLETSREYERYVHDLQKGLHVLLDNLRILLGYPRYKQHFHVSLRRVNDDQAYTGRGVWM